MKSTIGIDDNNFLKISTKNECLHILGLNVGEILPIWIIQNLDRNTISVAQKYSKTISLLTSIDNINLNECDECNRLEVII